MNYFWKHWSRTRIAGLIGLFTLLWGCESNDWAKIQGSWSGEGCYAKIFPWEAHHFRAVKTPEGALIQLQDYRDQPTLVDTIDLVLSTHGDCPDLSNTDWEVGPEACAQIYIRFLHQCPDSFENNMVDGQLTFTSLGLDKGDLVEGHFEGTVIQWIDQQAIPQGSIQGDFSFHVQVDPAHRMFTDSSLAAKGSSHEKALSKLCF